jgi:hypothetical protein
LGGHKNFASFFGFTKHLEKKLAKFGEKFLSFAIKLVKEVCFVAALLSPDTWTN